MFAEYSWCCAIVVIISVNTSAFWHVEGLACFCSVEECMHAVHFKDEETEL